MPFARSEETSLPPSWLRSVSYAGSVARATLSRHTLGNQSKIPADGRSATEMPYSSVTDSPGWSTWGAARPAAVTALAQAAASWAIGGQVL